MKFDAEEWKQRAKEDFEMAWHRGPEVLTPASISDRYPRKYYPRASPHPIFETIHRLREVYLQLGFDEAANPLIIEEQDIYRQFGPEASAVLDRVFYLAGLPRPNIGIAKAQVDQISRILGKPVGDEMERNLKETLHAYKKATIDGDELLVTLAGVLETDDAVAVRILDEVFPEFRELVPEPSRMTLRSHMTSGWFLTLASIWDRVPSPIRLFSVDRCFRREQEEGPTRLMTYHSASCVVAGPDITAEDGMAVSEALLSAFGFTDFTFRPDEKRSKYYMPDTQTEVYARHPVHDWVEVATFGVYSPSALAEYGIGIPVMNLGLGVERLAMICYGSDDVRQLTYPQFFPRRVTDSEIARAIDVREKPHTVEGREIVHAIVRTATEQALAPGPCSFTAWRGTIQGTGLEVIVEEREEGARLCGPACFNEIVVHHGSVLGIPATEKWAEVRKEGVSTGITYLEAAASLAASRIEEGARCGKEAAVQVKMAKLPSDINLRIAEHAMRYITDHGRKVDVRGPVFLAVRSETVP
jgi:O-phosphoseryl-tRNA synthetase